MKKGIDLKQIQKNMSKTLKQASDHLEGLGKETSKIVRRGEEELVKVSKMGRAQVEIMALTLKKEQLYRQIGMKVWKLSTKGSLTTKKLRSFCQELAEINTQVKTKKKTIDKAMRKK